MSIELNKFAVATGGEAETKPGKMKNKIVEYGLTRYRKTNEYKMKITAIQKQVIVEFRSKPRPKNILSRILWKIKMDAEINKRIRELSSNKNLHISN